MSHSASHLHQSKSAYKAGKTKCSASFFRMIFFIALVAIAAAGVIKPVKNEKTVKPDCACDNDDWHYRPDFKACYLVIDEVNFESAKAECAKQGASLTSIHSSEENFFVMSITRANTTVMWDFDSTLIGAQRTNGEFVWIDGSAFDYTMWAKGEPNNWKPPVGAYGTERAENEDCVALYADPISYGEQLQGPYIGRWNDNICSGTFRTAVCKKASNY